MKLVNAEGQAALLLGERVIDIEQASGGTLPADPALLYHHWTGVRQWAASLDPTTDGVERARVRLGAPSPTPAQVFAIGLNYRDHAEEGGLALPDTPMVFTKFPSCITGPDEQIMLPPGSVDYEAEMVVVIGQRADRVERDRAWAHVAGLTVGQDLSERQLQIKPPAPQQFSLAKSFPGFGPTGPMLVTPEELTDPDDLEIGCLRNGVQLQKARTGELIFDVATLVSYLSAVLPLLPGDLIFTGTPSGVGFTRNPQTLLRAGDELITYIEGLGRMRHHFVQGPAQDPVTEES
jgi:2-keto-4-pentenoate hydratase/2-oxohepta-3-ene-1,7-dioic acid hydratase in catechol pathway